MTSLSDLCVSLSVQRTAGCIYSARPRRESASSTQLGK
ncbi:hypothetical protein FQN60_012548 [Etheostoma spectabile]|uniref:Uncharacterized protein n=1 Tax=Etheostoma spectabile TaxID=54343 RepID=A0A5J5DQD4_9PERO|nr:hypothetical protein FQN60_012548 [Etheostoma spectabile]